jgi:hypothetical protein
LRRSEHEDPFEEKFDVVVELNGGLAHRLGDKPPRALDTVSRLKPGGTLTLVPLDKGAQNQLLPLVKAIEDRGGGPVRTKLHGDDEMGRVVMPGEESTGKWREIRHSSPSRSGAYGTRSDHGQ